MACSITSIPTSAPENACLERGESEDELHELGEHKHGANHREERQSNGQVRGTEPRVFEEAHIKHRVVSGHLPPDGLPYVLAGEVALSGPELPPELGSGAEAERLSDLGDEDLR